MAAPTVTEIRTALEGLKASELAPLGMNLDMIAALLSLLLQSNTGGGGTIGGATETTLVAVRDRLPTTLVGGKLSVDGSGVTQPISGSVNVNNISGNISLPTGAATSAKQPSLGVAGTPSTDVLSIQGITNGTPISITQSSNAITTTSTFSSSTTSTTFTIANRLALIVCPAITGAPTLTLQVTLDGGTTWINTSVTLSTDASLPKAIEADSLAKLSGAFGLTNAFRFNSSASISSATLNIRSILQ